MTVAGSWLARSHPAMSMIADSGYVSQPLFEQLPDTFEVQLITKFRKNMKTRLLP